MLNSFSHLRNAGLLAKGPRGRTPSDKLKADRAKRAEQRQKLKEKMMAAKKLKKRRSSGKLRSRSCDAN